VTIKSNKATADGVEEKEDWELVRERNDERRKAYNIACIAAENQYVSTTKPAELIAQILHMTVDEFITAYNSTHRVPTVLLRLGLDVTDVDGPDIAVEVRRENHAVNVETLRTFASKNSTNLARAVAIIKMDGSYSKWSGVEYPEAPEYEGFENEDEDYDDEDPL
jgi:hypothetical protein